MSKITTMSDLRNCTRRFACLAALVLVAGVVAAQDAVREVQAHFATDESRKTFTDFIDGFNAVEYRVTLREGQRLAIALATDNISNCFDVYAPGAQKPQFHGGDSGSRHDLVAVTGGEYRIRVYLLRLAARDNQAAQYTLTLTQRLP